MARVRDGELKGSRIRVHGDLHLGQILHTGKDFVILDFEGEPARTRSHRRGRRSPMADVAGMIRSFHYAAHAGMKDDHTSVVRESDRAQLEAWADVWQSWTGASYLRGYLQGMQGSGLLPDSMADRVLLLETYTMEKALYELAYELDNRPSWVATPLRGLLSILGS
jgi:maltose alpha-D-glucosyltransferase/alpha-amylase